MNRPRRPIMSTMRMRRSEYRDVKDATSNGCAHARGERVPPLLLRESDEVLQQQRLDAVPDEAPDDIKEEDAAGNAANDVPADLVVSEEPAGAMGQHGEEPEDGQRRIEDECARNTRWCRLRRPSVAAEAAGWSMVGTVSM